MHFKRSIKRVSHVFQSSLFLPYEVRHERHVKETLLSFTILTLF